MRALVVSEKNAAWALQDVPEPVVGAGQVLIRVRASGLCYTDVHFTRGPLTHSFPCILGHEAVGEIVAVGEAVTSRIVGDRVGVPWDQKSCNRCEWCKANKAAFCESGIGTGVNVAGGHAEYMVAYADATVLIPQGVPFEEAAPILCAGYTVVSGLHAAQPRPGERIAVHGIGGLGHLALQYAKAAGFETYAITSSADKVDVCRTLGADDVFTDPVRLARAGGADVILATSNSYRATADALRALRPDGRLVLMGVSDEPLTITRAQLSMRHRIIGSGQNGIEFLYQALDGVARGRIKPMVEVYPMRKVRGAYTRVAEGRARFRVVLVPEPA